MRIALNGKSVLAPQFALGSLRSKEKAHSAE